MKISTNKLILEAAKQNSDEYIQELKNVEGIDKFESTASWKEIAFFIKGAMWMKDTLEKEINFYLANHTNIDSPNAKTDKSGSPYAYDYIQYRKDKREQVKLIQNQIQEEVFKQFE